MSYAHNGHADWLKQSYKIEVSPLGEEVANILGYVGGGLYNAPINIRKVNWEDPRYLRVLWGRSMANWDGRQLTQLVIECHRRMIRVEISPCNPQYLKLEFWKRKTRDREAGISSCLPDIEYMVTVRDAEFRSQE